MQQIKRTISFFLSTYRMTLKHKIESKSSTEGYSIMSYKFENAELNSKILEIQAPSISKKGK